jgi:hypothetical protein
LSAAPSGDGQRDYFRCSYQVRDRDTFIWLVGLARIAGPKIDCGGTRQIGRNTHIGMSAHSPELEWLGRLLARLTEGTDNRVIDRDFGAISVQNPFDTWRMLREPGIHLAHPSNMFFDLSLNDLSLNIASDTGRVFLVGKILHINDSLGLLVNSSIAGIPIIAIYILVFYFMGWLILRWFPLGTAILAVGGNSEST